MKRTRYANGGSDARRLHAERAYRPAAPSPTTAGPRCPLCTTQTVLRFRTSDGKPFYGCARFPHCRGALPATRRTAPNPTCPTVPATTIIRTVSFGPHQGPPSDVLPVPLKRNGRAILRPTT